MKLATFEEAADAMRGDGWQVDFELKCARWVTVDAGWTMMWQAYKDSVSQVDVISDESDVTVKLIRDGCDGTFRVLAAVGALRAH